MLKAIVSSITKRAFLVGEAVMIDNTFFNFTFLPNCKKIEVKSVGSSTIRAKNGDSVNTVSIQPEGTFMMSDCYHIVTATWPEGINADEFLARIEREDS